MSASKSRSAVAMSVAGQAVTRSGSLIGITHTYLAGTGTAIQKFAERLSEAYVVAVPEALRRAPLKVPALHGDAKEYYTALQSNCKVVQRYLDGTVPIPVDLEEVWCQTLPEPFRDQAIFELCSRFGVLPVRISGSTDIRALADLMREEAAMIEAMAPIMADGEINAADREAAIEALPKVQRAMSSLAGLQARLEVVIGSSSLDVVGGAAR